MAGLGMRHPALEQHASSTLQGALEIPAFTGYEDPSEPEYATIGNLLIMYRICA